MNFLTLVALNCILQCSLNILGEFISIFCTSDTFSPSFDTLDLMITELQQEQNSYYNQGGTPNMGGREGKGARMDTGKEGDGRRWKGGREGVGK